jgi:hypothetical protein
MPWLGRAVVKRGVGGWVCGMVTIYCLAFFGGLFDGSRGGDWELRWVWVVVSSLLRVVVTCESGSCFGLELGAICVLRLRRLRRVQWVLRVGLMRLCMRSVTYSSSSPVMTYLRWVVRAIPRVVGCV